MSEYTIIKLKDILLVPLPAEINDMNANTLQDDILKKIENTNTNGLILDMSVVWIVDSFLGRLLNETAKMARLMGVETVLVGLKKEVVMTLIQLGLQIKDVHTALNLEDGIILLEEIRNNSLNDSSGDLNVRSTT